MDVKLLILGLVLLFILCNHVVKARKIDQSSMHEKHEQWVAGFNKTYKDNAEKAMRFKIFQKNVEYIESLNKAGNRPYKLGINEFADLTNAEFQASHNGFKNKNSSTEKSTKKAYFRYENVSAVPAAIDWRTKGAVTPIKDQGQCGRVLLGFSAVAAIEGIHKLKTRKLISLSEQELVDCDTKEDQGCEGGLMDNAFEFIIKNHGITTEEKYPYKAEKRTCNKEKAASYAAKITGFEDVPSNSESCLQKAVANQPVSVAIDASSLAIQFYSSGVFTGECGTDLDHGVAVVGYGTSEDGLKYWLVKNSWGTNWGENGYIRIQRDVDYDEGLCGIAMEASYPTA